MRCAVLRSGLLRRALASGFLCGLTLITDRAAHPQDTVPWKMPWNLRDRYTFTIGKLSLGYAVDNAQWRLEVEGGQVVIDGVGATITLADGSVINVNEMGLGKSSRDPLSSELGEGVEYSVTLPAQGGLAARHLLAPLKNRPFYLICLEVGNAGKEPIEISKISPLVFGPGCIGRLSTDAHVLARPVAIRGPYPVIDNKARSAAAFIHDRNNNLRLGFAVIPLGIATSGISLESYAGAWQGEVASVFDPPIRLAPGEKILADPVWLSLTQTTLSEVDRTFAWLHSVLLLNKESGPNAPRCWVTADSGASADELCAAIEPWRGTPVKHALVPAFWEGRTSVLGGAPPNYPKDMAKLAARIRALGMEPGLTVDPLAVAGGSGQWTAVSEEGQRWLNASSPEALRYGIEQMRQAVKWGFTFFVVRPSRIPDDILRRFNMTRAQADTLAFKIMISAATDLPVLPSVATALSSDPSSWLAASGSLARFQEYRVPTGPVGLDTSGLSSADDVLSLAVALYPGPLEFSGKPPAATALSKLLTQGSYTAWPVDIAKPSPKLWCARARSEHVTGESAVVIMFPGALPWTPKDLGLDGPHQVWRAEDGRYRPVTGDAVTGTEQITIYSVLPAKGQPMVLGASPKLPLCVFDTSRVVWDEAAAALSGAISGTGTACVAVPAPWKLRPGNVLNLSMQINELGDWTLLLLDLSSNTSLDLKFRRD